MATGFSIPVKANVSGGVQISQSGRQIDKLIRLALAEGDDDNPFQDLGMRPRAIYQSPGPIAFADIKIEIERLLRKFKDSIAISPSGPVTVFKAEDDNEVGVSFTYIDLETNEPREFVNFFSRPGSK